MRSGHSLKFLLLHLFFLVSVAALPQNGYRVSDIPRELLTDAKAVIRMSETEFEIRDVNSAIQRVRYAITVLNENGISNSVLTQFYNKFLSIRKINWKIYDQDGEPVKRSDAELSDYSAISGYSLYEDSRVKLVNPNYRTFPFTVEYSYEIVYNGLLFFPVWEVYDDYNLSVERSSFKIIKPKDLQFRFLEKNLAQSCTKSDLDDRTSYTWEVKNMKALREEPFSIPYEDYAPVVYSAPNDFEIGGYRGNCQTWEDFSKWIDKLGEGREELGQGTVGIIRELVSGAGSDYEKIKAIYSYMQNRVRYVSIQTGIGGWQATDAGTVDRLCYGDCKALANYMKCLLDAAGIKSYYALVNAGEDSPALIENFPSNQFNHAMICVPLPGDTIWLECTNQHIPAGYIGKFTDDRKVLLTGDGGGKLVRTRAYTAGENLQARNSAVILDTAGNAVTLITTKYSGTWYDELLPVLLMDEEDRKTFLQKRIALPSYKLSGFRHSEERHIVPSINEELKLDISNYGTILGNRILITPNVMTRFRDLPYRTGERRSVIRIRRPYIEKDTVRFTLPQGYKLSQAMDRQVINSRFGEYSCQVISEIGQLLYIRTFSLRKGDYPVTDYDDFLDFCGKVASADEGKIVLEAITPG